MGSPDAIDVLHRWFEGCHRLGVSLADATAMGERLVAAYTEDHRHHHDLGHVKHVLTLTDGFRLADDERMAVELALWFHDAVYDPRGADNEAASADLARSWLVDLGHDRLADHVAALVRSTAAHEPPAGDRAAAVVNDVDLAICAAEPHEYERYVDAIRAEYAWLDDRSFADGRARVLESLLARPRLYHTPELAPILEPRARHNLTTELAALAGEGDRDRDPDPDPDR